MCSKAHLSSLLTPALHPKHHLCTSTGGTLHPNAACGRSGAGGWVGPGRAGTCPCMGLVWSAGWAAQGSGADPYHGWWATANVTAA